jgi:hypothetical protein
MSSTFFFWTHFVLVTLSHFLVLVLAVSMVTNFVKSNASLLDRLRRFAMIFFITVLGVNHLTSSKSECILTTMENRARVVEGKAPVGEFLPRYYRKIEELF